ncbi:MAG: hypothetical protein JWM99_4536 [Verrucomicrobiales bacterium]|nr:hypothetical protein [Verrucomicrobiales bacterium]
MTKEQMKSTKARTGETSRLWAYAVVVLILLQCSCATTTVRAINLPANVVINKEAGHGGHLMVMLRLESGEELPFEVDTGSPVTFLDRSLENKLGRRLGTMPVWNVSGDKQTSGIFKSIKLYSGKTPLITADHIQSYDFKQHPMGILGMDCLRHYCIQLDFEARAMRFLRPDRIQMPAVDLGKAFPLTFRDGKAFVRHRNFLGNTTDLLVDLGCNIDGLTEKGTNLFDGVYMQSCHWEGEKYLDLIIASPGNTEALGLRFLARHMVTLDFPGHALYLKRTDNVSTDEVGNARGESARMSGLKFLLSRARKAQLPGWPVNDEEPIYFREKSSLDSQMVSFRFREADSFSLMSYEISRTVEDTAWRLLKAWKVYENGRTNEVLVIP